MRVLVRNTVSRSEDQVRKYLGRAVANTAIEAYYSRKRDRVRNVVLQEDMTAGCNVVTPQTILEECENRTRREFMEKALGEALGRLSSKQYEALRITMLEPGATSIREAGAMSGIAYSTLRHRSMKGLSRLRRFVQRALRSSLRKAVLA